METSSAISKDELVRQLMRSHFDLDEGIERIIWVKNGNADEIQLIEVNRSAIPAGDFYPFYFAPSQDARFSLADSHSRCNTG
ncbi:MAG: hypothetical protein ONB41_07700 [candidate division KSB1 bacterium]|nr:hypothetical protein [candidate division KSB1 bacterium]